MGFWSSQTLEGRLGQLIDPPNPDLVDCNAVTLRVGREIFITPHVDQIYTQTKKLLGEREPFQMPPEQFAFILTEEIVRVPNDAMAFISMKATFKMLGLVNVSGFHVDPGFDGPLIFAVFNAGPSHIQLERGLPLFLIWYADLDAPSSKHKVEPGKRHIAPEMLASLSQSTDSLYALGQRLDERIEKLKVEDTKLNDRVHAIEKFHVRVTVIFAVIMALISLVATVFREPLLDVMRPRPTTVLPSPSSGAVPAVSPSPAPTTQGPTPAPQEASSDRAPAPKD